MPFAQFADVSLFYTDDGEGEIPLLFVHGYTADSHDWSWQLPHFRSFHRVIAVDLRGHGASSVPADGYTTLGLAQDLVGLLDHLGIDRVVAVGHSLGGSVVSALAVEYPGRVVAIVAADPAYLVPEAGVAALSDLLDALPDAELVGFVQSIVGSGMDSPGRDPGLREWQVRRVATRAPHVLRQALKEQVAGLALLSQSEPYLRRRQCPVLSFHSRSEPAEAERALLPEGPSRVISWEGTGHWLQQEHWVEFNALVSEWLDTLD